ncbi:hypothetical protein [Yoonia sp. BS5-3]|uniref:Porin n=1 Tax=Yoonia phaeophyticola TaxID=3137369 RepID=A0ABZ2V1Q5_9RHOB
MISKLLLSTVLVAAGATTAMAQGFTGATIGLEYSSFPDIDEFGGVNYFASAEFGLISQFSAALDLSFYDFEFTESDVSNLTGHAIYAVDSATSVGLFFGQDRIDDVTTELFGIEAAYDFGIGDIQAYFGSQSDSEDDGTFLGASASYNVGSGFSGIVSFDKFTVEDVSATVFEIGAEYTLQSGPRFSAIYGVFTAEEATIEIEEPYFVLAAVIDLGAKPGTTFDRRGYYEIVDFASLDDVEF